jgi:heparan-alpha-glucosaminide N-acetyltransferase
LTVCRAQFLVMFALLAVYLSCQHLIEVPGCPRGYIGPGGLGASPQHAHCTGGAHRYVIAGTVGEARGRGW